MADPLVTTIPTVTCDPPTTFPLLEWPDAKVYRILFSCGQKPPKGVDCPLSHPVAAVDRTTFKAVPGRPGWYEITMSCSKATGGSAGAAPLIYAALALGSLGLLWWATRQ